MHQHLIQTLDEIFQQVEKEDFPYAVRILTQGQVVYERYFGYANREYRINIEGQTVFPISSVTKPFTAMVIMQLVEEGRLTYSDSISKFFSDFPAYGEQIQIEHLLQQLSGLKDIYYSAKAEGIDTYDIRNEQIYQWLVQQELEVPTGSEWQYCNSNYMLLAMIAEQICQQPFGEILQERIFKPTGMEQAGLYDQRYVIPNRAYGYRQGEGQSYTVDCQWLSYGDGGIYASLDDLSRWECALDAGDLVSSETLELAFTPGKTTDGQPTPYGFGWAISEQNGVKSVWHSGGDPGFGSLICRWPEERKAMIILSNQDQGWETIRRILDQVEVVLWEER